MGVVQSFEDGWDLRPPGHWPAALLERQRAACILALREEIARMRNSLIVITSLKEYGIVYDAVADETRWEKKLAQSTTSVFRNPVTGNIFVRCHHPNYMMQKDLFDAAAAEIVQLARETLPLFRWSSARTGRLPITSVRRLISP